MAHKPTTLRPSYKNLLAELNKVKERYQTLNEGHRTDQYELMAIAMRTALVLDSDHRLKHKFLEEWADANDVVFAAMILISGAKSKRARKKAWKRARALRYLVEELDVSVEAIPAAIKEHNGIEALVRCSAEKTPRRKTPARSDTKPGQGRRTHKGASVGTGKAHDEGRKGELEICTSDLLRRPYSLDITPKLQAKFERIPAGMRLKLVGRRGEMSGTFEVEKIIKLKLSAAPAESLAERDENEWI